MVTPEIRVASFRDLPATMLYAILKLRVDVFVVEQECAYPELDGRDTELGARHVWLADGDEILAYLRILDDGDTERIGRVVTSPSGRNGGYASRLMEHALTVIGSRPAVLAAQAHLTGFYERFGFLTDGPEYLEDGIPHVPMRRP
ncbi:GNAT family N-acetyltransferase [Actinoplanes sp. N902-109]|uniref:GNAT family N-acetyltransferase n=1 Tax=Actinoplanes sp. (strain N902-109) TaxID=649831 RepID=UPI0003295F7C|nr:GNAT family N-acetyltransferase [Actinoplanes sp. N902-109]AGL20174.1 GCN5 N-acetyltransferase [Actinoplanes sp. N902-109]